MSANRSNESVRELAYRLWEQRGGSGGSPEDDWYQAEQLLSGELEYGEAPRLDQAIPVVPTKAAEKKIDRAVEDSFPASDPPAVHTTDEPPVNAGEKWKAVNEAKDDAPPSKSKPASRGNSRRGTNA